MEPFMELPRQKRDAGPGHRNRRAMAMTVANQAARPFDRAATFPTWNHAEPPALDRPRGLPLTRERHNVSGARRRTGFDALRARVLPEGATAARTL
jgi:hypothetical protein